MTLKSIFFLSAALREGGAGSGRKPSKSVEQTKAEQDSARAAWKSATKSANRAQNSSDDDPYNQGKEDKANQAINKANAAGTKFNAAVDAHNQNISDHIAYLKAQVGQMESIGAGSNIQVKNWFWGAAQALAGIRHLKNAKTPSVPRSPKADKPHHSKSAHDTLHKSTHPLLAESCARVLGGFKSKKECISSSTNTANLVKSRESKIKFHALKFLESSKVTPQSTKFRVVLLEEGLGNFNDAYYYTRDALESGVSVFNGLKIFADHPSLEEEEIRPERSTRDILGHYENVAVEDGDEGCAWLCADVDILPSDDCSWARDLMIRAIENEKKFPDKPFIGLSINAGGDAQKTDIDEVMESAPDGAKEKLQMAKDNGIELVKVVQKINRGTSCDLVTEAGAGGKILNIIGENDDGKETKAG